MSNTSYFRIRWGQTSALQRRMSRRTRQPVFRKLVLALGRGWFTRRISPAACRGRWLKDLSREGRAAARLLGWMRARYDRARTTIIRQVR